MAAKIVVKKKKRVNKVKRRFRLTFFLSLFVSLFITVHAANIVPSPWYIDVIPVVLSSLGFSSGLALLASMKFGALKKNGLSLFVVGIGIALSLVIQLDPDAMFWHSFLILAGMFFIAGLLIEKTFLSFE